MPALKGWEQASEAKLAGPNSRGQNVGYILLGTQNGMTALPSLTLMHEPVLPGRRIGAKVRLGGGLYLRV